MKRGVLVVLIFLTIAGLIVVAVEKNPKKTDTRTVNSYEECVKMGLPVMESYPTRCITPDGRSFTKDIGNELEFLDEIIVDNPRPNHKIESPLKISGKARGTWFFEANFSAELVDVDNKPLGNTLVTAKDEWMTEEFVPFEAALTFNKPQTNKGRLIFSNANPSGLAENEKTLIIPVGFEIAE